MLDGCWPRMVWCDVEGAREAVRSHDEATTVGLLGEFIVRADTNVSREFRFKHAAFLRDNGVHFQLPLCS